MRSGARVARSDERYGRKVVKSDERYDTTQAAIRKRNKKIAQADNYGLNGRRFPPLSGEPILKTRVRRSDGEPHSTVPMFPVCRRSKPLREAAGAFDY